MRALPHVCVIDQQIITESEPAPDRQHLAWTRRRAAIFAGYSPSSADNPGYNIERRGRGGNPIIRLVMDSIRREQTLERDGAGNKEESPA